MKNTLKQHYQQMLGLNESWDISEIDLDIKNTRLTINLFSPRGIRLPCPLCKKLCPKEDAQRERKWRHLDTMQFKTIIKCKVPRVRCSQHKVKTVELPWAKSYSRFTLLFEKFAIDVIESSKNISSAMKLLRLSWKQIFRIERMAVERGLDRREDKQIDYIGIYEKSFLKGHSYVSVLNDLTRGCVLDVVTGRTQDNAVKLLESLSLSQRATVKAIAMDMWKAFINAAKEVVPQADIVHDKYHVAGYLGKAVDSVRKSENKAMIKQGSNVLKGTKYLWLSNPKNTQ